MDVIEKEISTTLSNNNIKASPSHYASRLDGSCRDVFQTLRDSFEAVRKHINHVVIHATVSKGSPSTPGTKINI